MCKRNRIVVQMSDERNVGPRFAVQVTPPPADLAGGGSK
jgi:hypothetical protein